MFIDSYLAIASLALAAIVYIGLLAMVFWPRRFSLRGLMICTTILALVAGLVSVLHRWNK